MDHWDTNAIRLQDNRAISPTFIIENVLLKPVSHKYPMFQHICGNLEYQQCCHTMSGSCRPVMTTETFAPSGVCCWSLPRMHDPSPKRLIRGATRKGMITTLKTSTIIYWLTFAAGDNVICIFVVFRTARNTFFYRRVPEFLMSVHFELEFWAAHR